MKHATGTLRTSSGAGLFRQSWTPEEAAATVVVVHGYGEHGGRYSLLAKPLVEHAFAVHAVDLRGHGRSPGRRGHVDRFTDYVDDTRMLVADVRREHPGIPLFLIGHSLGGLIAALHAQNGDENLDGLVLSSPFMALRLPISSGKIAAARLLSRLAPACSMSNPLKAADLSHDADVVRAYEADELVHRTATARWGAELLGAQTKALARAPSLRLPLLVQYAGADAVADPGATERLFAAASSPDKTLRRYEDYYHEIYNETGRAAVYADLVAWLHERSARRTRS